jgi:hypothetical protein
MVSLVSGIVVIFATAISFWAFMPRGGRTHRFVDTELEPYVAVLFTACVALGLTLMLSGVLDLLSA